MAKLRIDEMYAFVSQDDDGEGIVGFKTPDGWMPMVAADMARVESLKPMAEKLAVGMRIALVRFSTREVIQQFGDDPPCGRESARKCGAG